MHAAQQEPLYLFLSFSNTSRWQWILSFLLSMASLVKMEASRWLIPTLIDNHSFEEVDFRKASGVFHGLNWPFWLANCCSDLLFIGNTGKRVPRHIVCHGLFFTSQLSFLRCESAGGSGASWECGSSFHRYFCSSCSPCIWQGDLFLFHAPSMSHCLWSFVWCKRQNNFLYTKP